MLLRVCCFLVFCLHTTSFYGQIPSYFAFKDTSEYYGYWSGDLRFEGYHLPLSFDISDSKVIFENPVQGSHSVTMDSTRFKEGMLFLYIDQLTFQFLPVLKDTLQAFMKEGDDSYIFSVIRNKKRGPPDRPQHPLQSIGYQEQEVSIFNFFDSIELAGTLSLPDDKMSALLILLTGSGAQDRDETLLLHKPFAVIADYLARRGIGVLRYDDRGVGKSSGSHPNATSYDFAEDASSAFFYLRETFPELPIGFLGHSEGGMIAQIADSISGGADFHIYLAAPGIEIIDLMLEQNRQVLTSRMSQEGISLYIDGLKPIFEMIPRTGHPSELQDSVNILSKTLYNSLSTQDAKVLAPSEFMYAISISQLLYLPWYRYFFGYKPKRYLRQISCPILAMNGEKDIQVTPDNLDAIKKEATQSDVTTREFAGMNHLFQECKSCKISEYGMITQTISILCLKKIDEWLKDYGFIEN